MHLQFHPRFKKFDMQSSKSWISKCLLSKLKTQNSKHKLDFPTFQIPKHQNRKPKPKTKIRKPKFENQGKRQHTNFQRSEASFHNRKPDTKQ